MTFAVLSTQATQLIETRDSRGEVAKPSPEVRLRAGGDAKGRRAMEAGAEAGVEVEVEVAEEEIISAGLRDVAGWVAD